MIPGVRMLAFSKDKAMAHQAAGFWVSAIHVMGPSASAASGCPEGVRDRVLAARRRSAAPPERPLSRRVALVTGGAGGIGKAAARRLLQDGAVVVLTDIDAKALAAAEAELAKEHGRDGVRAVVADVTKEPDVVAAVQFACAGYGGLDVVVCSAGCERGAVRGTTLASGRRTECAG